MKLSKHPLTEFPLLKSVRGWLQTDYKLAKWWTECFSEISFKQFFIHSLLKQWDLAGKCGPSSFHELCYIMKEWLKGPQHSFPPTDSPSQLQQEPRLWTNRPIKLASCLSSFDSVWVTPWWPLHSASFPLCSHQCPTEASPCESGWNFTQTMEGRFPWCRSNNKTTVSLHERSEPRILCTLASHLSAMIDGVTLTLYWFL